MAEALDPPGLAGLRKLSAFAAIVGGGLRVMSSFIPWRAEDAGLEALYGLIDVGLTFALLGVYVQTAQRVRRVGLVAFAVALTGLASIVGPDAVMFGIDFYRVGALVFLLGLAGLSVQLMRAGLMRASAACWMIALALSLSGAATAFSAAVTIAGASLGAGFVLAGMAMMKR